jgi:septal ring factor EnvC (AmiA/AmiB activator)
VTLGHRLRAGLPVAALGLALVAGPGGLQATSPATELPSSAVAIERARLDEVRERLVRRRALEAALDARAKSLAREIEALEARREQTWAMLHDARDQAQAVERQLDRLVPRLLARDAAVRERRERAARLLADLASTSRQAQLDPTVRARMLAISPLMLSRLRSAETGLAVLEREPDRLAVLHRELEGRAPQLVAEAQRLQGQREQTQRRRQALAAQLARVGAEVHDLSQEQQQLAAQLLRSEAARLADAGPKADQPALPDPVARSAGDVILSAAVKGRLPEQPQLASFAVHAVQPASSQRVLLAPDVLAASPPDATVHAELAALLPPPEKPLDAVLKGGLEDALPGMDAGLPGWTALDVVFLEPEPLADIRSRVAPARLPAPQAPLMPIPGEAVNPFSDQGADDPMPGISIVAAPGQAVAAPDDGRVVFAGGFKSYGLLLIIEHQREYHTLLWGFSKLDVETGDRVRTGQIVGVMAADVEGPPELHVEVRRNGRPVNPLPWLAASSNKVRG